MDCGTKNTQQKLLTWLFHPISRNEKESTLQQDFNLLNEQVENERSNKPMAKKQPVRRPKKLTTTLQPNGNIKKKQMMEFQRD
jgi:hypothetical protein